jgi:hypothetical protein
MLSPEEIERGWVAFECDRHGFLIATLPSARVNCRCGMRARMVRNGRILGDDLRPTNATARGENLASHPALYMCAECGEDFGGRTLQKRHRVGGKNAKRCLSAEQMTQREWSRDNRVRWRGKPMPEARAHALRDHAQPYKF